MSQPPPLTIASALSKEETKEHVRSLAIAGKFEEIASQFGAAWEEKGRKYFLSLQSLPSPSRTTTTTTTVTGLLSPSAVGVKSTLVTAPVTAQKSAVSAGGGAGGGFDTTFSDDLPIDAQAAADALAAIEMALATADKYTAPPIVAPPPRKKVAVALKVGGLALAAVAVAPPLTKAPAVLPVPDDDEEGFVRKRKVSEGGKRKKAAPAAKTTNTDEQALGAGAGADIVAVKVKSASRSRPPRSAVPTTTHGVFAAQFRSSLKISEPGLTSAEITAKVSLAWKVVSPSEKLRCANIASDAAAAAASEADAAAALNGEFVDEDDVVFGAGDDIAAAEEVALPSALPTKKKTTTTTSASSRPRAGAISTTSTNATDDDDLVLTVRADPRADALRSAASRIASGRSAAAIRTDGAIVEDVEGFSRERCFPRLTGRLDYRPYDVGHVGTQVSEIFVGRVVEGGV